MAVTSLLGVVFVIIAIITVIFFFLSQAQVARTPPNPPDDLYIDDTVLAEIDANRKINAIKHYREQTGVGLKAAKEAVETIAAHRDNLDALGKKNRLADMPPVGPGIRDLVDNGQIDEAVAAYRDFMGVDEYTARDAIQSLQSADGDKH